MSAQQDLEIAVMATYGVSLAQTWDRVPLVRRAAIRRLDPELAHSLDRATLELQSLRTPSRASGPVGRFFERLNRG